MSSKAHEHWCGLVRTLLQSLEQWPDFRAQELTRLPSLSEADKEKVGPHVLLMSAAQPGDERSQHLPRILHKRSILGTEIAAVTQAAIDRNARFLLQRAFAFQSYYPTGYIRQFNDLDIVVAGLEDLTRLLPALFELGYYVARPLVLRCADGANPWVGISLNKQRDDLPEPVMLDLCVGGPSISAISNWRVPQWAWDDLRLVAINSAPVPLLPPTFNLLSLFMEAFERDRLYIRDLLDLDRMACQPLDMEQLSAGVVSLDLLHEVDRFRRVIHRAKLEHLYQLFDRLPRVRVPLPEQPRWFSRVLGHMSPAAVRRSVGRAVVGLGYSALTEWLDCIEDAVPNASLWVYRRVSAHQAYKFGVPVYLFPAAKADDSTDLVIGPRFENTQFGDCVYMAGNRYVSRVRPTVSEDELVGIGG